MKRTIILWFVTCCIMLSITPVAVQAAKPDSIVPLWTNTLSVTANLSFNDTTGNVTLSVIGRSGVTNITADIRLYYKNANGIWTEIETDWTYDVNQITLTSTETFTGIPGCLYKIEAIIHVKKASYSESITKTATATC